MKRIRFIRTNTLEFACILCLYFAAFASLYAPWANKIGLYVAIPFACLIATKFNKGLHTNIYEKILYALFAWDFIAYLWADDKEMAAMELNMILGAFALVYCLSILARKPKNIPYLYFIHVILYLSAWNYAIHNILTIMIGDNARLNDETLNANTLAYYTFFISFLSYILSEIVQNRYGRLFWTWTFWLMFPFSFIISLLTASRQILIIQIPLYGMLTYIKYIKSVSKKRKLQFLSIGIIVVIALSGRIADIYNNSYLKKRSEVSVTDDERFALVENAIEVAANNLPLGVGSGNFQAISITRQISHNSYLEALVNMGIIGLALYLALLLVFIHRQWRRYKSTKDRTFFAFFTFGVIFALYGFFFVFYNAVWLISFFMLVAAHSETYYKYHPNEQIITAEKLILEPNEKDSFT